MGTLVKGEGEEVRGRLEFSFFSTCVQVSGTHWSARAYRHFEVGHLMGLFVFSQGVEGGGCHCGPFYLLRVSMVQAGCFWALPLCLVPRDR